MIEEMKKEFEKKFTHLNNLGGNRSMATVNADRIFQWIETKIDEACKKAKIEENVSWLKFSDDVFLHGYRELYRRHARERIKELNAPSPKESE